MRITLLSWLVLAVLVGPAFAKQSGFEAWPHSLFAVLVWIDDTPGAGHVTPYLWILNCSDYPVELDENSVAMTDSSGNGMERSRNQVAGSYVTLAPGMSRLCFPFFWRNQGRGLGTLSFRSGDGVRYAMPAAAGMTSGGGFERLPRPVREAAKGAFKSMYEGARLLEKGTVREKPPF